MASFADGTDLPLKSLLVNIEPVQSGSGDPSPTNIRPIGGWDAVGVHNGNTVVTTISLGRTVYGGMLNVLTGELVVDMAMVDLGTLTWTYSNRFFRANPNPEYKQPSSQRSTINALCTIYKNTTWNDVGSGDKEYAFSSAVTRPEIIIKDSDYTNSAAFKTAMSGVTLVYELAEPITYTLDPQTVRSLVGQNNIFSDTGNIALDYWAHP